MGLQESFEKLLNGNSDELYSIVGTIESVDKDKRTCVVIPENDPEDKLFGVRLQAKQSEANGLVCFPAANSQVVVTYMNKQTGYIALFSELESVGIVVGQQTFEYDKDGLLLKSQLGSLGSAWVDLIGILKNFKLQTNTGVTIAVLPDILTKLIALENKVKSVLKE